MVYASLVFSNYLYPTMSTRVLAIIRQTEIEKKTIIHRNYHQL